MDRGRLKALFEQDDDDSLTFQQKPVDKNKLAAFNVGAPRKSKKEKEREAEEAKRKAEEEEASRVFDEYVEDFASEKKKSGSGFVRASVSGGQTYAPKAPRGFSDDERRDSVSPPPQPRVKGKRAMDAFLDEIKREQADREHRLQGRSRTKGTSVTALAAYEGQGGSYDRGDPETTNLFVAHLPETVTEDAFGNFFGEYGEVTSIKIMWPRGDGGPGDALSNRRSKSGGLTGFVSFKRRREAELALRKLDGADWSGSLLRVGWSKAVPTSGRVLYGKRRDSRSRSASPRRRRPSRSRDGHKDDRSYSSSRSRSRSRSRDRYHDKKRRSSYRSRSRSRYRGSRYRSRSREEKQLTRNEEDFIELVGAKVRENGRDYEDMLLERERGNALFRFLFERRSEEARFYQDVLDPERDTPYGFDDDGYDSVYSTDNEETRENERADRTKLGRSASKRFKAMLRAMTGKRGEVARCMTFALEHGEAAPEVANIIVSSLVVDSTAVPRKMARLWLISDILHNSAVPLPHAWKYRQEFQQRLGVVFDHFSAIYHSFEGRLKADTFKRQVVAVVEVWDDWIVFPPEQTSVWKDRLEGKAVAKERTVQQVQVVQTPVAPVVSKFKPSAFKPVMPDLTSEDAEADMDLDDSDAEISAVTAPAVAGVASEVVGVVADEDLDGAPIEDVDVDGEPLEDMGGEPLDDLDGEPINIEDGQPVEEDEEGVDGRPFEEEEDLDGSPFL